MGKITSVIFFAAWLLCGCSVEKICDDWRACVIFVIGLIVVIASAAAITRGDN